MSDEGFSLDEVLGHVLKTDLEQDAARHRAEEEARRLNALAQNTDPKIIIGTSQLAAKIAADMEAKLDPDATESAQGAPEVQPPTDEEKKHAVHFPPPPRLGGPKQ